MSKTLDDILIIEDNGEIRLGDGAPGLNFTGIRHHKGEHKGTKYLWGTFKDDELQMYVDEDGVLRTARGNSIEGLILEANEEILLRVTKGEFTSQIQLLGDEINLRVTSSVFESEVQILEDAISLRVRTSVVTLGKTAAVDASTTIGLQSPHLNYRLYAGDVVTFQDSLGTVVTRTVAADAAAGAASFTVTSPVTLTAGNEVIITNFHPKRFMSELNIEWDGITAATKVLKSGTWDGTVDGNGNITNIGTVGWALSSAGDIAGHNVFVRGVINATSGILDDVLLRNSNQDVTLQMDASGILLSGDQVYSAITFHELTSGDITTIGQTGSTGFTVNVSGQDHLRIYSNRIEFPLQIQILGGLPGAGKVLTSDTNGLASWQTPTTAPVTSVFGRTGAVTADGNDYSTHYVGLTGNQTIAGTKTFSSDINFSDGQEVRGRLYGDESLGLTARSSFAIAAQSAGENATVGLGIAHYGGMHSDIIMPTMTSSRIFTLPDKSGTFAMTSDVGGVPAGVIVMWSGSIGTIPTGWALCDGTNGTPDLRDRFIVGAGSGYAVGATGGAASVTLSANQMPTHSHSLSDPGHSHEVSDPGHSHSESGSVINFEFEPQGTQGEYFYIPTGTTTGSSTTGLSITAVGTGISMNVSGGGQSHENRPPYYALAYIMKL